MNTKSMSITDLFRARDSIQQLKDIGLECEHTRQWATEVQAEINRRSGVDEYDYKTEADMKGED